MSGVARILKADAARRVTLENVGAVPRPVDIDEAQTGFGALKTLRIYQFAPSAVIHGHAEEDEVFIVILSGEVGLRMRSLHWSRNEDSFSLKAARGAGAVTCAAYLPPHGEYELTANSPADVAYVRARPRSARPPALFTTTTYRDPFGRTMLLQEFSHAERLHLRLLQLDTGERPAELMGTIPLAGESLIHLRTEPARAATLEAPGGECTGLESWDTLAVSPDESPRIRIAAHTSALSLVVSAA